LAVAPAFDGRFSSGALQGRTVNVKWYLKREGLLDVTGACRDLRGTWVAVPHLSPAWW